jgi:hypothetical protein
VAKACKPDLAVGNMLLIGRDDGVERSEHLNMLGISALRISGLVSRAGPARTLAIASIPNPHDAADMVQAWTLKDTAETQSRRPRPAPNGRLFRAEAIKIGQAGLWLVSLLALQLR